MALLSLLALSLRKANAKGDDSLTVPFVTRNSFLLQKTLARNCSDFVRLHELFSRCHSEERSDEESTISPPPGERYREGVFAIQLSKTEQLLWPTFLDT